jgi:leader peptidase (prepilin peptidase) / N-methyltransferase
VSADTLDLLFLAWVLFVGAAVGSFLNVVIARVPAGESIVHPRSRCPRCRAPIAWYDNVPVLSWVVLRGRCRRCRAPIALRYPFVELLVAAAAVAAFARQGPSGAAVAELVFVALLVALAFIDLDTWLLPHALTWPLIGTGLLAAALGFAPAPSLASAALGAAIGFGTFGLVAWLGEKVFRREALGWGDVWLLAGLGAWLGAGALLPVVLLSSITGSVIGIALVLVGRGQPGPAPDAPASASDDEWVPPKHAVPFGPFLVLGALAWLYLAAPLARAVPALEVFR